MEELNEFYDFMCGRIYRFLKESLNDTYVSVEYVKGLDVIKIYVRRGEIKFKYSIGNVSDDIMTGRGNSATYSRAFIRAYKEAIMKYYFAF